MTMRPPLYIVVYVYYLESKVQYIGPGVYFIITSLELTTTFLFPEIKKKNEATDQKLPSKSSYRYSHHIRNNKLSSQCDIILLDVYLHSVFLHAGWNHGKFKCEGDGIIICKTSSSSYFVLSSRNSTFTRFEKLGLQIPISSQSHGI